MAHYLIEKLFKKRGISDSNELSDKEKVTFDQWQATLTEGDITVDRIKEFCHQQLSIVDGKLQDTNNSSQKNERLIIMHNVYKAFLNMIEKPKNERSQLEKYLQNLVE